MLLPYVWLSLAIVWLWLPPQSSATTLRPRFGISAGWLLLAIGHAHAASIVSATGIVAVRHGLTSALCLGPVPGRIELEQVA